MLITVHGRLVRSHGTNDRALPGTGAIQYQPATHGTHEGALRGVDPVTARITDGEAETVELTPGPWRVSVFPEYGAAWEPWLVELTEDDPEVELVDLTPVVEIDGEKWVTGPRGISVSGLRDNGDGTVTWLYSDGSESDPYAIGTGPQGVGIESVSDPDDDSLVTITYTDGTEQIVRAIQGRQGDPGPAPTIAWDDDMLVIDGEESPPLTGPSGPANVLTIGTVESGSEPAAEITGDAPEQSLNLTLVPGPQGPAPEITWDESVIIIDGDEGPDLRGPTGIASVTSPESGVWMIDQATDGDEDRLKDLQEAVYDKATRQELEAVENASKDNHDQLEARVDDLDDSVGQVSAAVPKAAWHGSVTVEFTGGSGSATVTFPTGLFSDPPLVMLTKNSARAARHVPYVGGVTPTSAQVGLYDPTSSSSTSESILCAVYAYLP